jgi:transposase
MTTDGMEDVILRVFCGIDWAEDHHDVALVDADGKLIGKRRIGDDAAGFALLLQLLTDAGDSAEDPIPVAIETSRGLLVACLRATGRTVFAINPMAVSRYRDRHSVARKKSDAGDALMLAHILRTDMAAHRPLPADSELAQAIAVLARAQQDAVWERTCAHNKLRSLLREYYPGVLAAFADKRDGLLRPEARRTDPRRGSSTEQVTVAGTAQTRRPTAWHRGRSRPHPRRAAHPTTPAAAHGGESLRPPSPRPAADAQRRVRQRRGTRRGSEHAF